MKGLRTASVLVLDNDTLGEGDREAEALGILRAFASLGVGACLYTGNADDLPAEPLTGVRLAALDMDLSGAIGAEANAMIGPTLEALDRIISADNGPYVAIAWTKHADVVDAFRERVQAIACPPVHVVLLKKEEVMEGGRFQITQIQERLEKELATLDSLALVRTWEQIVHDSAGRTLRSMSDGKDQWNAQMGEFLATLVRESVPERLDDNRASIQGLFEALNSVHFDHLESMTMELTEDECGLVTPFREKARNSTSDRTLGASLNRRLLIGRGSSHASPGSLYVLENVDERWKELLPQRDVLIAAMVNGDKRQAKEVLESRIIVLEITAPCDYQQNNVTLNQLLCGLAIPISDMADWKDAVVKRADFIRRVGPLTFEGGPLTGDFQLAFNSRSKFALPLNVLQAKESFGRMRHQVLIDLESWLAGQNSRPGYLSVNPP